MLTWLRVCLKQLPPLPPNATDHWPLVAYLSFLSPMLSYVTFSRLLDLSEPPLPGGLGRICGCSSSSQMPGISTPLLSQHPSRLVSFPPLHLSVLVLSVILFSPYFLHTTANCRLGDDFLGLGEEDRIEKTPAFLRASGYIPGHSALLFENLLAQVDLS